MHIPLRPFLFFALLTTGACLNCETCNATGSSCAGETIFCSEGENVCVVAVTEIVQDGERKMTAMKGCESLKICTNPMIQFTVGNKTSYRASVSCCVEGECSKDVPELPPIQSKPNGVRCPGCFVEGEECIDETLVCTGLESFCFEVSSILYEEEKEMDITMKGCTTQSVCSAIKTGQSPMLESDVVKKAECDPKLSRGFRSTSLLLDLFSGLLLLRILL